MQIGQLKYQILDLNDINIVPIFDINTNKLYGLI